jgi:hypothetical protein
VLPNACTDVGNVRDPVTGHTYTRFKLAPGWAFHLVNGEWLEEKVTPGAITSAEDTDRIVMVRGRACCIFTVLGMDQFAQPIGGAVSPAVEKAERKAAKAERVEVRPPPGVKSVTAVTPTTTPMSDPSGPSKAALKLAKMRARLSAE